MIQSDRLGITLYVKGDAFENTWPGECQVFTRNFIKQTSRIDRVLYRLPMAEKAAYDLTCFCDYHAQITGNPLSATERKVLFHNLQLCEPHALIFHFFTPEELNL